MLQIRRMQEVDLEQVQAIDRLSFSLPWPANAYRYELKENPNSMQWVAVVASDFSSGNGYSRRDGLLVGIIVVWLILDEAHIATLAVHPDYRGQGIARELLAEALIGAIQRGAQQATLEVRSGNVAAQRLYYSFNFTVVGNRPRYYKDNFEDALIMTASNLDADYLDWLKTGVLIHEKGWNLETPQQGGGL
jgi:[ribosomal protein S18]-alanine N-acetyltransferase